MPAEREVLQEIREKEPIDFTQIFREKLASIKPNKSDKPENIRVRDWPSEVKIKKEAVALVFALENQFDKFELWLDDWQDIGNKVYPHNGVEINLKNFCRQKEEEPEKPIVAHDAFLVENQEGGGMAISWW